ncbi:MAG: S41 family peptidase, partial [Bacteroidota bacterium]
SRETTRDSTFQEVGGARYLNKPIYILISEQTFSMAELFAYAMKHFSKAIIIGQPSAGAAHAIDFLEIDDNYLIQVPISYNIHPVTKTDWEGKGVIPDISTKQEEALKIAHLKALDKQIDFAKKAGYERILKRYQAIKKKLTQE